MNKKVLDAIEVSGILFTGGVLSASVSSSEYELF